MTTLPEDRVTLYIDDEPRTGPLNMAIDEALLHLCQNTTLRFYRWAIPTLSIGYFQPLAQIAVPGQEWSIVRRWTGGGTVSHDADITFSIISPRTMTLGALSPEISYSSIHEKMIIALESPGLRLAECKDTISGATCFQSPALHDVLLESRKIAGGAQRRTRIGLLHQGSIQQIATSKAFPARFAAEFGQKVEIASLSDEVMEMAQRLVSERYGSPQWLTKF
ncbi:MAG: hypothetical protein ABI443_01085 [Chthoniobacterales bacterium]